VTSFWTVAAATLLNAFGLGCVTVYGDVKQELRNLQPSVIATLLCQFFILPPVYDNFSTRKAQL